MLLENMEEVQVQMIKYVLKFESSTQYKFINGITHVHYPNKKYSFPYVF